MQEFDFDIAIVGAGLAGLSLAYFIDYHRLPLSCIVLDSKSAFHNDRTWCFWQNDLLEAHFRNVVSKRWCHWKVGVDGTLNTFSAPNTPYCHISGIDYYNYVSTRVERNRNIQIKLSTQVQSVISDKNGAGLDLLTPDGRQSIRVKHCFDSRPDNNLSPSAVGDCHQQFLGYTIELPSPELRPNQITLMDFVGDATEPTFFYVLPFSDSKALVELTGFCKTPAKWESFENQLQTWLNSHFPGSSTVAEERGIIPMFSSLKQKSQVQPRHIRIGTAGGAVKASSGYAFPFVHAFSNQLALSLLRWKSGTDLEIKIPKYRTIIYELMDEIFLRVLARHPSYQIRVFEELFLNARPESVVRFMSEQASLADFINVITAMPAPIFVWEALCLVAERFFKVPASKSR